jgi:hypothetical protein
VALCSDGTMRGWGYNGYGQCTAPQLPAGVSLRQVSAGPYWTAAVCSDGTARVWGMVSATTTTVPPPPRGVSFVEIVAGAAILARRSDGSVVAWGNPASGMCNVPTLPPGVTYVGLAAGTGHAVARSSDGGAVTWGGDGDASEGRHVMPSTVSCIAVNASNHLTVICTGSEQRYATFADGCAGSRPECRIAPLDTPQVGAPLQLLLDNLPADLAVMCTGFSNVIASFGPLPLELGPFGMPGCRLRVSIDATALVPGSAGTAALTLPIPAVPALIGVRFHQQALVPDPASGNALGAVVSGAATAVIGG